MVNLSFNRTPSTDNIIKKYKECSEYISHFKENHPCIYLVGIQNLLLLKYLEKKGYSVFYPKRDNLKSKSVEKKLLKDGVVLKDILRVTPRIMFEYRVYNLSIADLAVVDAKCVIHDTEVYMDCILALSLKLPLIIYDLAGTDFMKLLSAHIINKGQITVVKDVKKLSTVITDILKSGNAKENCIPDSIKEIVEAGKKNGNKF